MRMRVESNHKESTCRLASAIKLGVRKDGAFGAAERVGSNITTDRVKT